MIYENTQCPCGGTKPAETMLCDECVALFQSRPEWREFQDPTLPLEYRRHAAIVLLSLAGDRKRMAAV